MRTYSSNPTPCTPRTISSGPRRLPIEVYSISDRLAPAVYVQVMVSSLQTSITFKDRNGTNTGTMTVSWTPANSS